MTEAIIPIGRTQFFGNDGKPVAGGEVYYYVPGTTTDKPTWQDPGRATLNTNPVPLDQSGTALVWGDGLYRMVLKDSTGAQVYDVVTNAVASGTADSGGGLGPQTQITAQNTTDLGSLASHNGLIVGNTTIANFGNTASLDAPLYYCEFDADTIVTNSVDLLVPGGADYQFRVGDGFWAEFRGASQWKIIAIAPKRGLNTGFGGQLTIPAGATVQLGANTRNFVGISGAPNISSWGNQGDTNRPIYITVFLDGGNVLVDSVNFSLIGGNNITTEAGDTAIWNYIGGAQWEMLAYFRRARLPITGAEPIMAPYYSDTPGAIDFTLPAEVTASTRIKITVQAAGGGGGGSNAGNTNGGSGGGGGAFWEGVIYGFTAGQHITGTVGAAGAGVVDAAGSAGGLSKVTYGGHDLVSCAGGTGGARSGGAAGTGGAVTLDMTGVTLLTSISKSGQDGGVGGYAGSDINWNGNGGGSVNGVGGGTKIANSGTATLLAGQTAGGFGGGGSGSVGGAGLKGGDGTKGFVKIELSTVSVTR